MSFLCVTSCLVRSALFSLTKLLAARGKNRTDAETIAAECSVPWRSAPLQQAVWTVRLDHLGTEWKLALLRGYPQCDLIQCALAVTLSKAACITLTLCLINRIFTWSTKSLTINYRSSKNPAHLYSVYVTAVSLRQCAHSFCIKLICVFLFWCPLVMSVWNNTGAGLRKSHENSLHSNSSGGSSCI